VHWENAPDHRTSRTLDWLNDACEAKLKERDRDWGEVKYAALISPTSIEFTSRAGSLRRRPCTGRDAVHGDLPRLSFDWKHPFTQANRAKLRLGKGKYTRRFPISLLLTTKLDTTDTKGEVRQIQPYVLLGAKKRLGRRAAVSKYELADVRCDPCDLCDIFDLCDPVGPMPANTLRNPIRRAADRFQCKLYTSTVALNIRFATESEAKALFKFLKQKSEPGHAAAKSGF
jgi:hypothetical protein